jgi:apolipoprotein N-acyltransferase
LVLRTSSRYALSLLTGLLLWLSFPGEVGFTPLLTLAIVPLLLAIRGATGREIVICGLLSGMVHYSTLLYWIITVVGKYGGLPWIVSVVAMLSLAFYMSLYLVLFALLARPLLENPPALVSLLLVPALWVGIDWVRGLFQTGFPWMDPGYALYETPLLIQVADLAGHHALTYLIVLVNVLVVLLIKQKAEKKGCLSLLLVCACLYGSAGYYSVIRLQEVGRQVADPEAYGQRIGVVQGNRDQSEKWSPAGQLETVESYIAATRALPTAGQPLLVVWPETALPFYPQTSEYMAPLYRLVENGELSLLSGAPWYEIIDREARKVTFFNSALLILGPGRIDDIYFKNHLVPFGEYVPFKEFMPFIRPLVEAVGDFSPGTIKDPLIWEEAAIGPLICFESVFPELSRTWVLHGANVLINLTNDAWYGKSSAPYQSLGMAVLRAVETRRALVRSANTGISAFIEPTGEIRQQSPIFTHWAAVDEVVLLDGITFWVRIGHRFGPACLALGVAGAAVASLASGRRRKANRIILE